MAAAPGRAIFPVPAAKEREEAAMLLPIVITSLPVEVAVAPMLIVLVFPEATLALPILMVSPAVELPKVSVPVLDAPPIVIAPEVNEEPMVIVEVAAPSKE